MLEANKIYQGDSLELFKEIESESVDLIIADPPYNIGKDFGRVKDDLDINEYVTWCKKWIDESKRVLREKGSIFIYGIHKHICYLQCYLLDIGMVYGRVFIWHYENGWAVFKNAPTATYEPILWFRNSPSSTYHPIREPYKSTERLKYKITKKGKVWTPNPEGRHGGDVWKIPTLAGRRFSDEKVDHPTQKPLALCDKIIRHFSNKGDLVLVPFAGSGSECVSALNNSRDFIGFEIEEKYITISKQRLKKAYRRHNLTLFNA